MSSGYNIFRKVFMPSCLLRVMLEKFLQEVISLVAGSGAETIVKIMFKKRNVNEFLIAKKLSMTINQTRNILYKLADEGLVYFNRKKDSKSGGWYTYFWTLDEFKCVVYYRERMLKEIEQLESSLGVKKTKQFYFCKTCGMEVTEEQALLYEFTCLECGEVFALKDSSDSIREVEKQIQKMKNKVSEVQMTINELENARAVAEKKNSAVRISAKKSLKKKSVKKGKSKKKSSKKKPLKKSPKKRKR